MESPDVNSKNPENEGKRILKVPGGWMVLNYQSYRERRSEEERREYMRGYMQEYRKRVKNHGERKHDVNSVSHGKPPLAQAEAEAEVQVRSLSSDPSPHPTRTSTHSVARGGTGEIPIPKSLDTPTFVSVWKEWMEVRKKKKACKDWHTLFSKQLEWLQDFGPAVAVEIINKSIRNDWQGLFPPLRRRMEPINRTVDRVLTGIRELSTKGPISPEPPNSPSASTTRSTGNQNQKMDSTSFQQFKTFKDRQLEDMLKQGGAVRKKRPRGRPTETGFPSAESPTTGKPSWRTSSSTGSAVFPGCSFTPA